MALFSIVENIIGTVYELQHQTIFILSFETCHFYLYVLLGIVFHVYEEDYISNDVFIVSVDDVVEAVFVEDRVFIVFD